MHFGLFVPLFGDYANARVLASLARDAETAGWEGFFLWDHVFTDWPDRLVDPWVALTAIALNTEEYVWAHWSRPFLGVAPGNWRVKRYPLITCQMVA